MSDSEDDKPIAQRAASKPASAPTVPVHSASVGDKSIAARTSAAPKQIEGEVAKRKQSEKNSKKSSTTDGQTNRIPLHAAPKSSRPEASSGKSEGPERVRKVFDLPGQTRDNPPEEDPLRRFYTSLLEQNPDSDMARRWCVMHGLLDRKQAEAWVADQVRKKGAKSPSKLTTVRGTPSTKKRKISENSEDEVQGKKAMKASRMVAVPSAKRNADTSGGKMKQKSPSQIKKKTKIESSGDEEASCSDEISEDSDAEEVMPKAKLRIGAAAPQNLKPASVPVLRKTSRDVAFADGGLDGTDSDDNVPLKVRMQKN